MTEQAATHPAGLPQRPAAVRSTRLAALATLTGATLIGPDRPVTGVTASSADVAGGDLFAALPGASAHGARFAGAALAAGAVAVLTDQQGQAALAAAGLTVPVLLATDPRRVLGAASAEIFGHPSDRLAVFGITGTSGKTTTTFLVRAGLLAAGRRCGLIGTVGVFLGDAAIKTAFTTPEAPQLQALLSVMAERGAELVGMEVSSHALRMGRVDGVSFEVGAFTNLSQDHLDFHTDMEDYFQAKALLFDGRSRTEIVVTDDDWGPRLVTAGTTTVSSTHGADWTAAEVTVLADGSTRFLVAGPGLNFPAGCRIPGDYNVANTLLAFAVLHALGVDVVAVSAAVAAAQVPGRMERVDGDQPFRAIVDYSHKPAGVAGALTAIRRLTTGRVIIVLGCGGDRDRGKRPVMGEVAARGSDVLIVTDDNPRSEDPAAIRAAMLAGAREVPAAESARIIEIGDRREAIERAVSIAEAGDTVLVAGKGHETGQQVGDDMLPFDDVFVVRQALVARGFRSARPALPDGGVDTGRDVSGR